MLTVCHLSPPNSLLPTLGRLGFVISTLRSAPISFWDLSAPCSDVCATLCKMFYPSTSLSRLRSLA